MGIFRLQALFQSQDHNVIIFPLCPSVSAAFPFNTNPSLLNMFYEGNTNEKYSIYLCDLMCLYMKSKLQHLLFILFLLSVEIIKIMKRPKKKKKTLFSIFSVFVGYFFFCFEPRCSDA